jgi:probable FeS assembly SUF system protein SufT
MLPSQDAIPLSRDCEAIQIPSGHKATLPKGTVVAITQALGGNYTVIPQNGGGMFSIASKDADALGVAPAAAAGAAGAAAGPVEEKQVWDVLKTCYDPEIPVNIVDLGLVYDLKLSPLPSGGQRADVKMTLTAPGCGMGTFIAADARAKILQLPGIQEADVQVVWDPPWNQGMITAEGRQKLGMA